MQLLVTRLLTMLLYCSRSGTALQQSLEPDLVGEPCLHRAVLSVNCYCTVVPVIALLIVAAMSQSKIGNAKKTVLTESVHRGKQQAVLRIPSEYSRRKNEKQHNSQHEGLNIKNLYCGGVL